MPDWKQYVRENLRLKGVRPERENEIVEDLAQQLEDAYRDALAGGLPEEGAALVARRHIADWNTLSADLQNSRRLSSTGFQKFEDNIGDAAAAGSRFANLFGGFAQDLLFAFRMMRKSPGFTAVAVLTLALGIGANTTIFSWINVILLEPLPGVAESSRIVEVLPLSSNESYTSMSYPDYVDFRQQTTTLEGLAVHDMRSAALSGQSGAERIWVEQVSDNYFDVLRVRPILGRGFLESEGLTPVPVVVVSEHLWRNRFGSDPQIIGRVLEINRTSFTVVGVAPQEFPSGYTGLMVDVWAPIQMSTTFVPGTNRIPVRGDRWLNTLARLKSGVTPKLAASELTEIARRIRQPEDTGEVRIGVFPLAKSPHGAQYMLGPVLMVLMGVVGVILLIACANIANLLLSRAAARRREFAIRLSIGCSPARLVRQLVTETLVLVAVAAVAAMLATIWTSGLLLRFIPPNDMSIRLSSSLDWRMGLFTAALALGSALFFGIVPALHASHTELATRLKTDSLQGGVRRAWLRNILVVSQLALSLLLLISASLFIRSLQNARFFNPGFKADNVLLMSLDLFSAGYEQPRGRQALDRILTQVRALPGVESATIARRVPLNLMGGSSSSGLTPEGYESTKGHEAWSYLNWVGPEYFRTMNIPVVRGQGFSEADRAESPEVLVVNQTFAARYWAGQDPIGKRIKFSDKWIAVAGVVADSKFRQLNEPASPFVYLSTTWNYRPDVILHVRTSGEPKAVAESVRAIVRDVDPKLLAFGVLTLKESVASAFFQQKLAALLLTAFGALALVLASVGLYASIAYSVSRRTRELGVRMALGASRSDIARLVLTNALKISAAGILAGSAMALGATRFFSSLLFGVKPTDPVIFGAVVLVLAAIALLASFVPARRAMNVDPIIALRQE